ncbi:hypothetical protein JTB14_025324 [Gonioctena quinquepunctata]|nr:hypothetical protein JTB14_025324 [Gonioctena quinquepunctata]
MAEENAVKRKKRSNKNNEKNKENESSDNKGKLNVENGVSQESELADIQQPNEPVIPKTKVNDYVVITYEQELYPRIITQIKHTGLKVKTICKSGTNYWK